MKSDVATMIVDMATMAATNETFNATYTFSDGTALVVSKNSLSGRGHASLASLPLDASGAEVWERAQEWQTAYDVAERLAFLASEADDS